MTPCQAAPIRIQAVDIRFLDGEAAFGAALESVSEYRRAKILRYRFRRDRNLSLGAALALDALLRGYGLREQEMTYSEGPGGKPRLAGFPAIHFNLSHGGDYAVCATGPVELGVDIEPVGAFDREVALRCMSPDELSYLDGLPEELRRACFTRLWTLKESALKASGTGLAEAGAFPEFLPDRLPGPADSRYEGFRFLEFGWAGYGAALCVRPSPQQFDIQINPPIESL